MICNILLLSTGLRVSLECVSVIILNTRTKLVIHMVMRVYEFVCLASLNTSTEKIVPYQQTVADAFHLHHVVTVYIVG